MKILIPAKSPEEWRQFLADPVTQWKQGYSAFELAHRWHAQDDFPSEVRNLLETEPAFRGIKLVLAIPELKVPLPGGAAASQSDLWVLADAGGQLVSIAVEGKVSEPFDVNVGEWLAADTPGRRQRWAYLCGLLGLAPDCDRNIRYQLVHRAASAIVQAQTFRAPKAALLVHSFSPSHQWFEDFAAFGTALGANVTIPGRLVRVGTRSNVELFVGWASAPVAAAG